MYKRQVLYSAPADQSASAVLTIANDGTGAAYDVALKDYDQKLTLDASTYKLHEGDIISGYRFTVGTPISSNACFQPGQQFTSTDGEKKFKFESFYIPPFTEIVVKSRAVRSIAVESVTGTFAIGNTISKGAGGNTSVATIFAVASILNLPKETVRRKIEVLKKKKLISHSTNSGLVPTDKVEEIMKPFASSELQALSKFLQALKKHKVLDQLLSYKTD